MARHRSYDIEFERQVAQGFIASETLHGLAVRLGVARNLIRVWVTKFEAGAFDEDAEAAGLLQEYEAKNAALRAHRGPAGARNRVSKGGSEKLPRPGRATTSVISGPKVFPPATDAV
jgi:transposase